MKKKPKIALIVDYHPLPAGGMEVHAYEVCKALKNKKELNLCAVIGFSSDKKGFNSIDKTIILPEKSTFHSDLIYKAIKKLKLEKGDVLFFNSLYWIRVIPDLKEKFPEVIFLLRSGGNDIAQSEVLEKGKTLKERRSFVVSTINKSVDYLVVNGKYSYRKLCGFGLDKNKMAIVAGGVDIKRFKPVSTSKKEELRKKLGLPVDKVIILSSCRLVRFKGIEYILKAISQSSVKGSVHYLLIGDGPEKEKIVQLIQKLKIQDVVTIVGEVSIERIHYYYQLSDIYCHAPILTRNFVSGGSYIHTETMGRSFCEAMSTGLPVIATKVGGVSEIVKDKESGELVPERDVYSLRKKIESLVLNRSKRKKMGVQGRKIAKKFSWEEVLKKYCFLIKYKNEK
jgi:glycosyltransferase involved in cell wall biosynthesis